MIAVHFPKLSGYEANERARAFCIHSFDTKILQARPPDAGREATAIFTNESREVKKEKNSERRLRCDLHVR